MKKPNHFLFPLLAGIVATAAPLGAATLFSDDFENGILGTGAGTNAGFSANDTTAPSFIEETGGNAVLSTSGDGNFKEVVMASLNSFNGVSQELQGGMVWTTAVDSWDGHDRDKTFGGILSPSAISGGNPIGGDGFGNTSASPGLFWRFSNEQDSGGTKGAFGLYASDVAGSSRDLLYEITSGIDLSQMRDGFSLAVTATAAGWSVDFTGLDSITDTNGNWGTHGYDDIFSTTTFVGYNNKWGTGDGGGFAEIDSVSVVSPIPEPTSAILTGLAGCLCLIRRRA